MISVFLKFYLFVPRWFLTAEVNQHIVRVEVDQHLTYTVPAEENLLVFCGFGFFFFFKRSYLH